MSGHLVLLILNVCNKSLFSFFFSLRSSSFRNGLGGYARRMYDGGNLTCDTVASTNHVIFSIELFLKNALKIAIGLMEEHQ